MQLTNNLHKDY